MPHCLDRATCRVTLRAIFLNDNKCDSVDIHDRMHPPDTDVFMTSFGGLGGLKCYKTLVSAVKTSGKAPGSTSDFCTVSAWLWGAPSSSSGA